MGEEPRRLQERQTYLTLQCNLPLHVTKLLLLLGSLLLQWGRKETGPLGQLQVPGLRGGKAHPLLEEL